MSLHVQALSLVPPPATNHRFDLELSEARARAARSTRALLAVLEDPSTPLETLERLADEALLDAGRVRGFAHLSR